MTLALQSCYMDTMPDTNDFFDAVDAETEAYYQDCDDREQAGLPCLTRAKWREMVEAREVCYPQPEPRPEDDDIPF